MRAATRRLGDSAPRPQVRERLGFTLIEVVVVLVLLGLVAGVTAPAFRDSASTGAGGQVAREVVSLLERARTTALERGTAVRVVLDPVTGGYTVAADSAGGVVPVREGRVTLPAGVTLVTATLRYTASFGATAVAGADTLRIRGTDGETRLTVNRWTGTARAE